MSFFIKKKFSYNFIYLLTLNNLNSNKIQIKMIDKCDTKNKQFMNSNHFLVI